MHREGLGARHQAADALVARRGRVAARACIEDRGTQRRHLGFVQALRVGEQRAQLDGAQLVDVPGFR
jgi:hypothetical protein